MTPNEESRASTWEKPPVFLKFRSSTPLIVATVAIALFTDLFLYGLVVPILPFVLSDRIAVPQQDIQKYTSILLAVYAGASVLFSLPAGIIADKLSARQVPFLGGLLALLASTILLSAGQTIGVLILARVLQGISAATVWTVGLALVLDTVGPNKLGVTIGGIFSTISVGALLAPVLGGIVYDKAGNAAVFGMGFALLGLDFLMRLVLIEKKVAARYEVSDDESGSDTEAEAEAEAEVDYEDGGSSTAAENYSSSGSEDDEERAISSRPDERTPLITKKYTKEQENEAETARKDLNRYRLPPRNKLPFIYRHLPILLTLQNPRLLTAQLISLTQATILSTFDATVPIEAHALFGFSSLQAGLLFIPFVTPYLLCSPFFGRCVDKYGTRWFAACGFVGFAVPLVLLRVPHAGGVPEIAKLSAILVLCSFGLASISALGIVESSAVLKRFEIVNGEGRSKEVFGKQGPYGQLYAINSMVFSTGLTVGPLVAGALREKIGFGGGWVRAWGAWCVVVGYGLLGVYGRKR